MSSETDKINRVVKRRSETEKRKWRSETEKRKWRTEFDVVVKE
jgi:hypothetical protein